MAEKLALLIANSTYADPTLRRLIAPADDAAELKKALEDPAICDFKVTNVLKDQPAHILSRDIEKFFRDRQRDDFLLLYFACHGIKNLEGQLFFAASDTELIRHQLIEATAISAKSVEERMSRSRSRQQVLLLDCCFSGAYRKGMLARGIKAAGAEQLQGQGRVVLTASNDEQYAFEGESISGIGKSSVFTSALVNGLKSGKADTNGRGFFSMRDIHLYLRDCLKDADPPQNPMIFALEEGEIILGNNPKRKPDPNLLPAEATAPSDEDEVIFEKNSEGKPGSNPLPDQLPIKVTKTIEVIHQYGGVVEVERKDNPPSWSLVVEPNEMSRIEKINVEKFAYAAQFAGVLITIKWKGPWKF